MIDSDLVCYGHMINWVYSRGVKITTLDISTFDFDPEEIAQLLAISQATLRRVKCFIWESEDAEDFDGMPIINALGRCSGLTDLALTFDWAIKVDKIIWLVQQLPSLSAFVLQEYHDLNDRLLEILSNIGPQLRKIDFDLSGRGRRITVEGLLGLIRACPNVQTLNVAISGGFVSDDCVCEIGASCPLLTELNLSGSRVDGSGLMAIAAGCPNLLLLNCDFNRILSSEDFSSCLFTQTMMRIQDFSVQSISGFDDAALSAMLRCCPDLVYVNMQETSISDLSLVIRLWKLVNSNVASGRVPYTKKLGLYNINILQCLGLMEYCDAIVELRDTFKSASISLPSSKY